MSPILRICIPIAMFFLTKYENNYQNIWNLLFFFINLRTIEVVLTIREQHTRSSGKRNPTSEDASQNVLKRFLHLKLLFNILFH